MVQKDLIDKVEEILKSEIRREAKKGGKEGRQRRENLLIWL